MSVWGGREGGSTLYTTYSYTQIHIHIHIFTYLSTCFPELHKNGSTLNRPLMMQSSKNLYIHIHIQISVCLCQVYGGVYGDVYINVVVLIV